MIEAQTRIRRQIFVAIAFLAATAALVATSARIRPRGFSPVAGMHLAREELTGPSRGRPISRHEATATLQPSEMPQGCLNCPVSSYLGFQRLR